MNREEIFGDLESGVREKMERTASKLESARDASMAIPKLESELERLQAILKILTEPPQPAPRKPRSDKGAKRAKAKAADANAEPLPAKCAECHGYGTMGSGTTPCTADGCDAHVCGACLHSHNARWHREMA